MSCVSPNRYTLESLCCKVPEMKSYKAGMCHKAPACCPTTGYAGWGGSWWILLIFLIFIFFIFFGCGWGGNRGGCENGGGRGFGGGWWWIWIIIILIFLAAAFGGGWGWGY